MTTPRDHEATGHGWWETDPHVALVTAQLREKLATQEGWLVDTDGNVV